MAPVVNITGGRARGTSRDGVDAFLGLPYAAPAVGPLRYRLPEPVVPWEGERDAGRHGPSAAQTPYPSPMDQLLPSSVAPGEEYLNVSVWAPSGPRQDLPVMVWIHGGAFVRGANSVATYDGSAFARDGVILVSVNYRLGAPGFAVLEGAPTNLGLRDQVAALEWVRDNIAAFGGDPGDVTIFGESAGGMSVATLLSAPAARGLFRRAIVQSGGGSAVCTLEDARRVGVELAALLGVPATAEAFAGLDPDVVAAAQGALTLAVQSDPDPGRWGASVLRGGLGIMSLFPVVDGDLVPEVPVAGIAASPGSGLPLLIGTTSQEMRLFMVPTGVAAAITEAALPFLAARYGWPDGVVATYAANRPGAPAGDVAAAILTDAGFRAPTAQLAGAVHAVGAPVHVYEFAWGTPVAGLGACHALELPFVFDTLASGAPMAGDAAPQEVADAMHRAWVDFAKGGDPGWPSWTPAAPTVATFGAVSAQGSASAPEVHAVQVSGWPRQDELALWG